MGDSKVVVTNSGIGLSIPLFILFLALQLTGHINWAWYWVAAPLWIPFGVFAGVMLVLASKEQP